jgi:hypothetical protein
MTLTAAPLQLVAQNAADPVPCARLGDARGVAAMPRYAGPQ